MFERFTEPGIKVVVTAQEEARKIGNNFVGTEQILLGLVAETSGIGGRVLRKYGVTLRLAREEIKRLVGRGSGFVAVEIPFTPRARRVLENAIDESKNLGFPYVGPEHILLGILMEDSGIAVTALRKILRDVNPDVTFEIIRKRTLLEMGEEFDEEFGQTNKKSTSNDPLAPLRAPNPYVDAPKDGNDLDMYDPAAIHPFFDPESPLLCSPVINEFTQNITQSAFAGEIDPVIGRDVEVERVLQILSRRRKNNPILLGEPGVGKTAVAEGLALQIIGGQVPLTLQGKNIISLDLGLLIAGSRYRGDFEKRLKRVINDIQLTQCYILIVDEVHTLVGAGAAEGSLDAANILKPALARGEFQCIGATTLAEYRKYIEPDAALARRFQSVHVKEPSVDDTISILVGIRDRYEEHHGVQITQNALEEAAVLSSRYINDRYLPDKALDIIDEACSRVRLGYELIPNICNEFEDQLAAICREKDAAYADKDWLTALAILREEIKFVQRFLGFMYDLIGKLREQRKIWVIRGLQQRYQFVLKGIGPMLKEWEIVLAIYDNEVLLNKLTIRKGEVERSQSPGSDEEFENLPEPENPEELENQLLEYRAELQNQPMARFVDRPPLDNEGNPMSYDESIPKKTSDRDFDEMNPFADQELDNIQKEIDNMEDLDRVEELQKKFDERGSALPDPRKETEEIYDDTLPKEDEFINKIEDVEPEIDKKKTETRKNKKNYLDWEYDENELTNGNETALALIKQINSSVSALEFQKTLSEFKIPFDDQNIPSEVAEAVQKKLFTDLFTPFTPKVDRTDSLQNFLIEENQLNSILAIKLGDTEKTDLQTLVLDEFLKQQKLWCLLSFIIWNKFLLNRNFEKKEGIKINKKRSSKKSEKEQENKIKAQKFAELALGKNQIGFVIFNLYKKQNRLRKFDQINLNSALNWRDLFHESLLERIGNVLIQRFGYGYGDSNMNLLPNPKLKEKKLDLSKESNSNSGVELSEVAKEFIANNPNWYTMDPKDYKTPSYETIVPENSENGLPEENPKPMYELSINELSSEIEKMEKTNDETKQELDKMSKKILKNHDTVYVPWVFASDIAGVVSEWTGIPVSKVSKNETAKLLNIEQELQKKVIGQPEAVEAIAKALRRGRVGLRDLSRPIASFFFSGPTGVGKTEVTKALAASYFGGESDMIRFDMSEFMERHTVSKLIGSPPGYVGYNEGGQLTEAVRRKPYVVILFDEVEKAHPDVFNLLLQVLEDGRLSDSQGRIVDFKNTIVVMTSNLGAAAIQNPDKFSSSKNGKQNMNQDKVNFDDIIIDSEDQEKTEDDIIKELVMEELKGFFRPEFLNRIDEIVVFRKLTKPDIREIAEIMLRSLKERLLSKSYNLLLSDTVIEQILEEGFDPEYGARPLRRVITNRLEDSLAAIILEKEIEPGSSLWVNYKNGEYSIYHKNFTNTEDLSEYFLKKQEENENEIVKTDSQDFDDQEKTDITTRQAIR